jgi:hypothetical protein
MYKKRPSRYCSCEPRARHEEPLQVSLHVHRIWICWRRDIQAQDPKAYFALKRRRQENKWTTYISAAMARKDGCTAVCVTGRSEKTT